jgi:hypothetical protein
VIARVQAALATALEDDPDLKVFWDPRPQALCGRAARRELCRMPALSYSADGTGCGGACKRTAVYFAGAPALRIWVIWLSG